MIDPLAMTVGADPQAVLITLETIRLIHGELGLNMTLGASNVSFGLPGRHVLGAAFLAVASHVGLTSAIMDARNPADRRCLSRRRSHPRTGRVGDELDRCAPGEPGGGCKGVSVVKDPPERAVTVDEPARVSLRFDPSGTAVRVPPGVTVFDAASWNGIAIDSTCGGHGTCKKCRVRIESGDVPSSPLDARAFSAEELADGWRLACRAQAVTDLVIDVPPLVTRPKAATVGVGRQVILHPALQKRYVELEEPSLQDQRSDLQRLQDGIDDLELRAEPGVLRGLPRILRTSGFKVTAVVVDDLLIDVEPGDTTERQFAIAFDLGTTTVVATLLDVGTGTPLAVRSMLNKQQPFGADVISRISATMLDPTALDRLRTLATETLQELAAEVCEEAGVELSEIYEVALAGNATMTAIVLGVDPEPLGVAPFILAARTYPELPAAELGLELHPRAQAAVFPALGAYVGGDIVAGLLATGMTRDRRLRLFIDVGTNCEVALGSAEGLICTAAPAGPAFEAAQIACGMRAAEGAIEVVRLRDGAVELDVIGGVEPVGMCGSGLVDAVAELVRIGLLDHSGRFVTEEEAHQVAPSSPHASWCEPTARGPSCCTAVRTDGSGGRRLSVAARRSRAPVRQGCDRDRLEAPRRGARRLRARDPAGAARRLFRRLPLALERDPDRARSEAGPGADRVGGQRRRRGREDGAPLAAGAPCGGGDARPGSLHRALRPHRLQRPIRRAARVPVMIGAYVIA